MPRKTDTPTWGALFPSGQINHERGGWKLQTPTYGDPDGTIHTHYVHTETEQKLYTRGKQGEGTIKAILSTHGGKTIQHYRLKGNRMLRCTYEQYHWRWTD